MSEHIAQMLPMLILAGLVVGLIAEVVLRAGGRGLLPDLGVGLVGSVILGAIVWMALYDGGGMLGMLLIGGTGGALAIIAQRTLWRSPRLAE